MLDRAKSIAIRKGLNMWLNGKYGKIEALNLDTKGQRFDLEILLNGETTPVAVSVGRYEIDQSNPERPVVKLSGVKASRPWIQELATDNVEGKDIEIPSNLAPMLKKVL